MCWRGRGGRGRGGIGPSTKVLFLHKVLLGAVHFRSHLKPLESLKTQPGEIGPQFQYTVNIIEVLVWLAGGLPDVPADLLGGAHRGHGRPTQPGDGPQVRCLPAHHPLPRPPARTGTKGWENMSQDHANFERSNSNKDPCVGSGGHESMGKHESGACQYRMEHLLKIMRRW